MTILWQTPITGKSKSEFSKKRKKQNKRKSTRLAFIMMPVKWEQTKAKYKVMQSLTPSQTTNATNHLSLKSDTSTNESSSYENLNNVKKSVRFERKRQQQQQQAANADNGLEQDQVDIDFDHGCAGDRDILPPSMSTSDDLDESGTNGKLKESKFLTCFKANASTIGVNNNTTSAATNSSVIAPNTITTVQASSGNNEQQRSLFNLKKLRKSPKFSKRIFINMNGTKSASNSNVNTRNSPSTPPPVLSASASATHHHSLSSPPATNNSNRLVANFVKFFRQLKYSGGSGSRGNLNGAASGCDENLNGKDMYE